MSPQSKNILIIGANSAVARAVARLYCASRCRLYLLGRDPQKLSATKEDLSGRGAVVVAAVQADLCNFSEHSALIAGAMQSLGRVDLVLFAHGELGEQEAAENDYGKTLELMEANFLSVVSLLIPLVTLLEKQQGAVCIAVITSVAGDRGRRTNYIYGAAKGALSIYLSGLRQRLALTAIRVLDIKLGLVQTPMTAHLRRGRLGVQPEHAARGIVRAVEKRSLVAYVPRIWRIIMAVVRAIPEGIFFRLRDGYTSNKWSKKS